MIKDYVVNIEKNNILSSLLIMLVGVLLIINPIDTINACIIIFGIILILCSVFDFLSYFKIEAKYRVFHFGVFEGIVKILLGLLMVLDSNMFVNIFPIILGVVLLLNSVFRIQMAINLKIFGIDFGFGILLSILTMILGIFLVSDPRMYFASLLTIIGIFIIVFEIINIVYSVYSIRQANKYHKQIKSIFE